MFNRFFILLASTLAMLAASLPTSAQQSAVERSWLFGTGHSAIYDEYLSPLDYTGPHVSLGMQNMRTAHWGHKRVSQLTQFEVNGSYAHSPGNHGRFYDGQVTVGFGWLYRFRPQATLGWDLALGGLAEFTGGGTYSTRNGNNPAQGRGAFDIAPSAVFSYAFHAPKRLRVTSKIPNTKKKTEHYCRLRVQLDVPLAGLMFSPQYGQSYYELFSLGHYDHNVCFTYPVNAPSARLQATLHVPVTHAAQIVVGYRGEARQSHVNDLGRHAWQNGVVVGFTRELKF